jgi:hypothetical protein
MYTEKRVSPRFEPCGTPIEMGNGPGFTEGIRHCNGENSPITASIIQAKNQLVSVQKVKAANNAKQ